MSFDAYEDIVVSGRAIPIRPERITDNRMEVAKLRGCLKQARDAHNRALEDLNEAVATASKTAIELAAILTDLSHQEAPHELR